MPLRALGLAELEDFVAGNKVMGKAFLTLDDVSEIIPVAPITIRRAIASRRLATHQLSARGKILISVADLNGWLARSRRSAVGEKLESTT